MSRGTRLGRARFEAGLFHALLGTLAGGRRGYGGLLDSHARRARDGSLPCPRCGETGFVPLRGSHDLARCTGCRTVWSVHRPASIAELFRSGATTDAGIPEGTRPGPRPPQRSGPDRPGGRR